jgi:uncharacterized GH25 family protein
MKKVTTILKRNKTELMISALIVLLSVALPAGTFAHSLYIQASQYRVSDTKSSPFFFCYGHTIPVADGVRGKKLKSVQVHTPADEVREISVRDETSLHSYMVDYDTPGTYVLTAVTTPGYYTVYTDKSGKERHVIKPKSAVLDRAEEISLSLFSKQYAKTYVRCETSSDPFPAAVGLELELVPTRDISSLKAGDTLELLVYLNGKPYKGPGEWDATYSGYSTEFEDYLFPKTTVEGGGFKIKIPNTGRWFVRYAVKVDAEGEAVAHYNQMKLTATLVFEIPNERKSPEASH